MYDEAADSVDSSSSREMVFIDTLFRRVVDMLETADEHENGDACAMLAGEPALTAETDEYHTDTFFMMRRQAK